MTGKAIKNHEELWPGNTPIESEPELIEFFGNLVFDDVSSYGNIDIINQSDDCDEFLHCSRCSG